VFRNISGGCQSAATTCSGELVFAGDHIGPSQAINHFPAAQLTAFRSMAM